MSYDHSRTGIILLIALVTASFVMPAAAQASSPLRSTTAPVEKDPDEQASAPSDIPLNARDPGAGRTARDPEREGVAERAILGFKLTDFLLLLLTTAALLLTWAITSYQWRLARKQYAVQLHAELYSVEYYTHIVAPTAQVRLKWLFLPDAEQRATYRAAVAGGWAPLATTNDPAADADYLRFQLYVRVKNIDADATKAHFHVAADGSGLSEHQSLAAYLHFWSRLSLLVTSRVIDKRLAKQFFKPAYAYNRVFIAELRAEIERTLSAHDPAPLWLEETRKLDRLLA